MTKYLNNHYTKLNSRIRIIDGAFHRHVSKSSLVIKYERFAFQEGLVSALWQSWCSFCRSTLISSASGATSVNGNKVTSALSLHTEMEIAYVAIKYMKKDKIKKIVPLQGNYLEPTWGDKNKLSLIINGIDSTNKSILLSAFNSGSAINDLQLCRNASAHINSDNLRKVGQARVRYTNTNFSHPTDMIYWVDPSTDYYLWSSWIREIKLIAWLAVQ